MNGQLKKHNKTLVQRGLPQDSYFTITLSNGEVHHEKDTSWSDNSEEVLVSYFGGLKRVRVLSHNLTNISIRHGDLSTSIDVPVGCSVYQAVRSQTIFTDAGTGNSKIIGRVVGLVRGGEVIEERFLDGLSNTVVGFK